MPTPKELVKRFFNEVVNGRKFDAAEEMFHKDYRNYGFPIELTGPAAIKAVSEMMVAAFPDMHILNDEFLAEGNTVATRGSWTGTHKGEFMGVPATGKSVKCNYIDIWKVKDGKLHENWVIMDIAGVMHQLNS